MSTLVPDLYHWSPKSARKGIKKRGLLPRCETSATMLPVNQNLPHHMTEDEIHSFMAVCLGHDPADAWQLSGAWSAKAGEVWDLWQVILAPEDVVFPVAFKGTEWHELRVANRIPKSRVWYVGSRTVGSTNMTTKEI